MDGKGLSGVRQALSLMAVGLAACQLIVAFGVAILPPPASSEGGPLAGLFYATYYSVPLALVGLGLRSRARWLIALVGLVALALVILHSAPLLSLHVPSEGLPWQRILAGVLSALSGMTEAAIFVVSVGTLLPLGGSRRAAGSPLQ